jgi:hypothetical protein
LAANILRKEFHGSKRQNLVEGRNHLWSGSHSSHTASIGQEVDFDWLGNAGQLWPALRPKQIDSIRKASPCGLTVSNFLAKSS